MDRFIARENVRHLRVRLCSENAPGVRSQLQRLLIEEEDKLGASYELLADIERHIDDGNRLIERQRVIVQAMQRDGKAGQDAANSLLDALTDSQGLHTHYRKLVLIEIERN